MVLGIPAPHSWTDPDQASTTNLQSLTDALDFMLGIGGSRSGRAPLFRGLAPASAQNIPSGTPTRTVFTAEVDTAGGWNGTQTYTIPLTGRYDLAAGICFSVGSATGVFAEIRVNSQAVAINSTADGYGRLTVFAPSVPLSAGDQLDVSTYQGAGSAKPLEDSTPSTADRQVPFFTVRWAGVL